MEPLGIIGIDVEGVSLPIGDGGRGGNLYSVPIQLTREPSYRESRLLVQNFDKPSEWTTMHRAGIARVVGDRLILGGTTIDAVEQYHARTVRLAVDATNVQEADAVRQEAADSVARDEDAEAHRTHVADVAKEIDFS